MRHVLRFLVTTILAAGLAACDDGGDGPDGGGADGAAVIVDECEGQADGTACGTARICVDDACVDSVCGDGLVDRITREECDDGNEDAEDGCEPGTCTFTCRDDAGCDDEDPCNGPETCDPTTHACAAGDPLAEGAACSTPAVADGLCRPSAAGARCVPPGCGNGLVDGPEDCDDGRNGDDADGCTDLCTFTCTADIDCDDEDVCTGAETCDLAAHVCVSEAGLDCTDGDDCTMDLCHPVDGCSHPLVDEDSDGHAPTSLGACGTDCDDTRSDVNPGVEEQCDAIDHDCDGASMSPSDPFWFPDCDGDEYATLDALPFAVQACDEPAAMTGCAGGWTIRRPIATDATSIDCDDMAGTVHPGATEVVGDEIDQDCDGSEVCFLDHDDDGFRRPSGTTRASSDLDCRDSREARRSEPATDCCDQDARAHRGVTSYFTSPRTGCGGFDYDCSGGASYELPGLVTTLTCGSATPSACTGAPEGWYMSRPACGTSGEYYEGCDAEMAGGTTFCAPQDTVTRTARCR